MSDRTEVGACDEKWVVDDCPDANGHWTIRPADGTVCGDTNRQPVATVYSREAADHIVLSHNYPLPPIKLVEEASDV